MDLFWLVFLSNLLVLVQQALIGSVKKHCWMTEYASNILFWHDWIRHNYYYWHDINIYVHDRIRQSPASNYHWHGTAYTNFQWHGMVKIKIKPVGRVQTPVLYKHQCRNFCTGAKLYRRVQKMWHRCRRFCTSGKVWHRCLYSTGVCTHPTGFIFIFL